MADENTPDIIPPEIGDRDQISTLGMREVGGPLATQPKTAVAMQNFIMSAQPVARARNPAQLMQRLKTLCKMHGERFIYSWQVWDNQNKRYIDITGPTVKLTNVLAREYGNLLTGIVHVEDQGTHWLLHAAVCDMETGYNYIRPFRQRKGQDTGMKDKDRAEDIVFQIGCSKAIRNAISNALEEWKDYMMEECDAHLIEWVQKAENQERLQNFIDGTCEKHGIHIKQIEAVIGRPRAEWTARNKVRVMTELRGVADGLSNPQDLYPSDEDADKVKAEKDAKRAAQKGSDDKPPAQQQQPAQTGKAPAAEGEAAKKGPGRPAMSAEEKALRAKLKDLTGKPAPRGSKKEDVERLIAEAEAKIKAEEEARAQAAQQQESEPQDDGSGEEAPEVPNFTFNTE